MRSYLGMAAIALTLVGSAQAQAQNATVAATTTEERLARRFEKGDGAAVFDVLLSSRACTSNTVNIRRVDDVNGKLVVTDPGTRASVSGSFFGLKIGRGNIVMLPPSEYVIGSVLCRSGNSFTTLHGPFARFTVRARELTDIGVLKIDYETKSDDLFGHSSTGTMRKTVLGMTPDLKSYVSENVPNLGKRLVVRRMKMIGPPQVAIKGRSGR